MNKKNLFIPMYIDMAKLFDLNSIINDGFYEFKEINLSTDNNSAAEIKGKMRFNLFKINGDVESSISKFRNKKINENSKCIQTAASMLSNIYKYLNDNKKIKPLGSMNIGDFIELDIAFNCNSIIEFLKDCHILFDFANKAVKLSNLDIKVKKQGENFNNELKIIDSLIELVDNKSNVVEFVGEDEKYIYVVYLNKEFLYNTQLERLDGYKLRYLVQVINISEDYSFLNDTSLSKINPKQIEEFVTGVKNLSKNDIFSKRLNLKTEVGEKKVVVLDVISILRVES